jgi:hypothetical protein
MAKGTVSKIETAPFGVAYFLVFGFRKPITQTI